MVSLKENYVFDNTTLNINHQLNLSSSFQSLKTSSFSYFTTAFVSPKTSIVVSTPKNPHSQFSIWHNRLGHPFAKKNSLVLNKCNLSHLNKRSFIVCFACYMGKIHKLSFPHSTTPLDLIHLDLQGPTLIPSSNEYRYYIHFINAYSWFTWIYMLKQKSKAFQALSSRHKCNVNSVTRLNLCNLIGEENIKHLCIISSPME